MNTTECNTERPNKRMQQTSTALANGTAVLAADPQCWAYIATFPVIGAQ